MRVNTLLKQTSAQASETATEDQVGDHSSQNRLQRHDFELDVTENPPTSDQLRTLLEYLGEQKAGHLVYGAKDAKDAMAKLRANAQNFIAPVVSLPIRDLDVWKAETKQTVDWNNGRAGKR